MALRFSARWWPGLGTRGPGQGGWCLVNRVGHNHEPVEDCVRKCNRTSHRVAKSAAVPDDLWEHRQAKRS